MTASDHLKHRTGSLGRDQDEKAVEQLISKMVDRSVFTSNELALCNRIQELESALAQKTRECAKLREEAKTASLQAKMAFARQQELQAQVEQLGRQVAHYQAGLSMYDECDCGHTRAAHCNLKRADGPDVWGCSECTCPNFNLETQAGMPEVG